MKLFLVPFFLESFFVYLFVCLFLRQGFSVHLAVLKLALVDQADLKLTEIHMPLPPECLY